MLFNLTDNHDFKIFRSMCKMKTSSTRFTAVAEKLNGETIRTYKTSLTSHTLRMKQFGAMIDIEKLYDKGKSNRIRLKYLGSISFSL